MDWKANPEDFMRGRVWRQFYGIYSQTPVHYLVGSAQKCTAQRPAVKKWLMLLLKEKLTVISVVSYFHIFFFAYVILHTAAVEKWVLFLIREGREREEPTSH